MLCPILSAVLMVSLLLGCGRPHLSLTTQPALQPAASLPSRQTSAAEQLVAALDNSQVTDWCFWRDESGLAIEPFIPWHFTGNAVRIAMLPFAPRDPLRTACAELIRTLIAALDDPNRFVAAHLLLNRWWATEMAIRTPDDWPVDLTLPSLSYKQQSDQSVICDVDGLKVRLKKIDDVAFSPDFYGSVRYYCTASIDPTQRRSLSVIWLRRQSTMIRQLPEMLERCDHLEGY